jgi:hypothetical protein
MVLVTHGGGIIEAIGGEGFGCLEVDGGLTKAAPGGFATTGIAEEFGQVCHPVGREGLSDLVLIVVPPLIPNVGADAFVTARTVAGSKVHPGPTVMLTLQEGVLDREAFYLVSCVLRVYIIPPR